jgi:hypothetical protein
MNPTHFAESIRRLCSPRKLGAPIVVAAGLSVAALGLGAGSADARSIEVTCPTGVAAGQPSTVTLAGWPLGGLITAVLDNQGDQVDAGPALDIKTFTVDHDLATYPFYLALPPLPSGRHDVDIMETKPQSNQVGWAQGCTLYVK